MTCRISNSQVLILQAIASGNGLTKEQIAKKSGVPVTSTNLGPVYQETLENCPNSLCTRKLVRASVEDINDKDVTMYYATASGKKLAESHVALTHPESLRIPAKVLDPVVKHFKALRPYGLERFTEVDLQKVLKALPTRYNKVPIEQLRQQIVNRRKQRAYVDENACKLRSLQRIIREFGPTGTVIKNLLTAKQLNQIGEAVRPLLP